MKLPVTYLEEILDKLPNPNTYKAEWVEVYIPDPTPRALVCDIPSEDLRVKFVKQHFSENTSVKWSVWALDTNSITKAFSDG